MSLINKMLQDLDIRAGQAKVSAQTIIADLHPANDAQRQPSTKTHYRGLITWLLLLSSILILMITALNEDLMPTDLIPAAFKQRFLTIPTVQQTPVTSGTTEKTATAGLEKTFNDPSLEPQTLTIIDKPPTDQQADPHTAAAMNEPAADQPLTAPIATTNANISSAQEATQQHKPLANSKVINNEPAEQEPVTAAMPANKRQQEKVAADPTATLVKTLRDNSPEKQAARNFQSAINQYQRGHIAQAEDHLQQTLQQQPRHIKARTMLAQLMMEQNRWAAAQQTLITGMTLLPKHYPFNEQLAHLLVKQNQTEQALLILEGGLQYARTDGDYLSFLAALYQRTGQYQNAAKQYQQALELRPLASKWWLGLGLAQENLDNWPAAKNAYIRARLSNKLDARLDAFVQQRLQIYYDQYR